MKALTLKFDGKQEVSLNLAGCWVNQLETNIAILSGDVVAAQSLHRLLLKNTEFVPYENMGSKEDHYYEASQKLDAALQATNPDDLAAVIAVANDCPYLTVAISY